MGYRIKAGLRRFARRVVLAVEHAVGRPISKTTKFEIMMSATSRSSFAWAPARREEEEREGPNLFVRVEPDVPVIEEEIEMPAEERVYSTPSYTTITTPTSSGAVMYEFSSRNFDIDMFGMGDTGSIESQAEVYEAPAIREHVETEEERQFYEDVYDDLTVEAVLAYMDTVELYAKPKECVEDEPEEFYEGLYEDLTVEAVLDYMDTIELYASPAEYVETEEEKHFFEGLYEYLAVDAVLEYMEIVDLCASPAQEQVMAIEAPAVAGYIEAPVSEIAGYISAPAAAVEDEPEEFYEGLYEDLTVEAVLDYMDTIELYAAPRMELAQPEEHIAISAPAVAGYISAPASVEHVETEEERRFYESVYEDLTVFAVLDYMDTIELYAKERPAPEYVISEIEMPQEAETKIVVEPARPAQLKQSKLAQFVFGFDVPAKAEAGTTKFRFIAGEEEEPEEDIEDVQIMTYSGDAAVSAQSVSNGPLAL